MTAAMLKLMAEDAGDLDIIGAAVQDALVRVGEISFDQKAASFHRYAQPVSLGNGRRKGPVRTRALGPFV